jgi:hypothetical protein
MHKIHYDDSNNTRFRVDVKRELSNQGQHMLLQVNLETEALYNTQLQQIARNDIPLGFGIWAWAFGMYDQLEKVKLLTTTSPWIDGIGGWGSQCELQNGSVFGASTVSHSCVQSLARKVEGTEKQ